MAPDDHVPPDVLAEDAGSFIEWDTENPTPDDDRRGNIAFNLGVHRGLMMKLKNLQGGQMPQIGQAGLEAEYQRGWDLLQIITDLAGVARRLDELGHVGVEANYATFEEAARMCKEGLEDIKKQMVALTSAPPRPGGPTRLGP